MSNLIVSFNVVAPLLMLMLLGAFLLRIHIFDSEIVKKMNAAIFKVFLPALIFNNLYTSSINDVKDIRTGIYAAIVLALSYLVSMVFVSFAEKDSRKRGVMAQGICRSNFVIFGVPLCRAICGDTILGKISVAVAIVVPVINIFAVFALEFSAEENQVLKKCLKAL